MTAHETEADTSVPDESAPTDPSLDEADDPTRAASTPVTRRRRILPTPPRNSPVVTRPQRNRKTPVYLKDYIVSKQAIQHQPEWLMKINWLESEVRKGRFKGLEMELSRTILNIISSV